MSSSVGRDWEYATTAFASRSSSRPTMCSAKFRRAPGNHSAPGISREPRTRSYGACERTSKNSQTDDQKPSRSETDHRQSSS